MFYGICSAALSRDVKKAAEIGKELDNSGESGIISLWDNSVVGNIGNVFLLLSTNRS